MTRAEEAALRVYPNVEQPVWDESYPKTLFVRHTERNAFIKGYEQAEKDLIGRLVEFYPTLDYTFRGYMVQAFPELKGKVEHYD